MAVLTNGPATLMFLVGACVDSQMPNSNSLLLALFKFLFLAPGVQLAVCQI